MKTYFELAQRTSPQNLIGPMQERIADNVTARLTHAQLGLSSEVGEFSDALKKFLIYGKAVDRANLIEELGDIKWYIAEAATSLGVTEEEIDERNIAKLKVRFPDRFTEDHALNRDLTEERKTLEQ